MRTCCTDGHGVDPGSAGCAWTGDQGQFLHMRRGPQRQGSHPGRRRTAEDESPKPLPPPGWLRFTHCFPVEALTEMAPAWRWGFPLLCTLSSHGAAQRAGFLPHRGWRSAAPRERSALETTPIGDFSTRRRPPGLRGCVREIPRQPSISLLPCPYHRQRPLWAKAPVRCTCSAEASLTKPENPARRPPNGLVDQIFRLLARLISPSQFVVLGVFPPRGPVTAGEKSTLDRFQLQIRPALGLSGYPP